MNLKNKNIYKRRKTNMYSKAKIYKVVDNCHNECYYGSTIQPLSKRMGQHREKYHKYKNDDFSYITVFSLFDKYGLENCKIELVENYECKSKEELHQREAYYIKNNDCVNKFIPGRTKSEWREDNKEYLKEVKKEDYINNKEKVLERSKKRYEEKKEEIKEYRSEKIECECGSEYTKHHKKRHERTQKHINFISNTI